MATDRQATAGLGLLRRALDALDVDLPDAVTAAHDRHDTIVDGLTDLPSADMSSAVAAALADGRDPTGDPAVQRAVTAGAISGHGVRQSVTGAATGQVQTVYADHAGALVDVLRGPFDRAAEDLAAAHATLGDIDLDDTDTIVKRGPDAASAWSQATTAAATVKIVTDAWGQLYDFVRGSRVTPRYRILAHIDMPPADFLDAGLNRPAQTPVVGTWDAVVRGWTFDLADFDQHKQRVSAIATERQDRKDAAEEKSRRPNYGGYR